MPIRRPIAHYDLVVTVAGPRADMVTRRKERRFGIWINTDSRQFLKVPTYLALFSNRPFDAIASPEVQRRQQLGLNNVLLTQRVGGDYADVVPERRVPQRLRAAAPPARPLPRGDLGGDVPDADAVSHRHSAAGRGADRHSITSRSSCSPTARWWRKTETAFEIVKVGFEQFVATTARRTVLSTGWSPPSWR